MQILAEHRIVEPVLAIIQWQQDKLDVIVVIGFQAVDAIRRERKRAINTEPDTCEEAAAKLDLILLDQIVHSGHSTFASLISSQKPNFSNFIYQLILCVWFYLCCCKSFNFPANFM